MENLEVIQVKCNCGKMADEVSWDDTRTVKMLSKKFGSLDDYYFFICECGEIISMHYTGYDCLLEEYDFVNGIRNSADTQILFDNGKWEKVHKNQYILKDDLDKMVVGYIAFNEFNAYEDYSFMRKGFEFLQMVHNPIHKTYELYKFVADEGKITNLLSYFNKAS